AVRSIGPRQHLGDGAVVDGDGRAPDAERGGLAEKCGRLREHAVAIRRGRRARVTHERADLDESGSVLRDVEGIGVDRLGGRKKDPKREKRGERQKGCAAQDGGSASAASCRSNASLGTRRS